MDRSKTSFGREQRRRPRWCRSGIANIWVALLGMFLIVLTGLSIDVGYALVVAHQLQNAADASALAGVQKVRIGGEHARQAAIAIAVANRAGGKAVALVDNPTNDIAGDIVIGRYNRNEKVFTATLSAPNAVRVVASRSEASPNGPLPLFFGGILGVKTVELSRHAIGMIGGGTGAGIICLNEEDRNSLTISGDVIVNTGEGAIQVNSEHSTQAVFANGNPTIRAPALNVCGEARLVGGVDLSGPVNTGVNPIPDPLQYLEAPTWDPGSDLGTISVTGGENLEIGPGYYSGGIEINNGSLTLSPGIYIVDGAGLNVSGNATFVAEGVMFYIVGSCVLDLTGTNEVRITPPNPDIHDFAGADTYERISIFQARDNTSGSRIIGTSLLDLQGTLYFPSAPLEIGGTGEGFGNQLIADKVNIHGQGEILIKYDGNEPAVGNKVFLVE